MRTLILLGASVRAMAQSAARAGFAPYAIDQFADRDVAALGPAIRIENYPADFATALAAAPNAPWLYTGGLENFPQLISRLATIRPLRGNPAKTLRAVRDPKTFAAVCHAAGCPCPQTHFTGPLKIDDKNSWLIKSIRTSAGLGVRFAPPGSYSRPPRGAYFQQFITGQSAGAVFIAASGRARLIGLTRQIHGNDFALLNPFLYVGSLGPLLLTGNEHEKLLCLGNHLAARFQLVGLFNIDFIHNAAGIWPLELNPRYSASVEVIERYTGLASIDLHVHACESGNLLTWEGEAPAEPRPANSRCAGKYTIYATHPGIVPAALHDLVNGWNPTGQQLALADIPCTGEPFHAGQPVITVLAEAPSLSALETELRRRAATVQHLLGQTQSANTLPLGEGADEVGP